MKVTIGKYYRAFNQCAQGILGILSFVPPLFGLNHNYIYPPLGDYKEIWAMGTITFVVFSSIMVFHYCSHFTRKSHGVAVLVLIFVGILSFITFMCIYSRFVKVIVISDEGERLPLSIGFERTHYVLSNQELANLSDADLLSHRGYKEEQIQEIWTIKSIYIVRSSLWLSCTCFLVCWISIFSFGVYQHVATSTISMALAPRSRSQKRKA